MPIKIRMPNLSQESQAPSKSQNEDLKDMDVLCTFKIKIRAKILNMGLPGVKLMHKCINTQMPNEIYKQLIFPKRFRQAAHIRIANSPRMVQCRRSLIYKATCQFNQLLLNLKYVPVKIFKLAIKKCNFFKVPHE